MLLVIDVGNTNTSLGVYRGAELVAHWRLTTARARTVDEYGVHARNLFELAGVDFQAITAVAIASVVPPLNFTLKRMSEVYFNRSPLFIDHTTETGVPILYNPPGDVGADRIVDAVAAVHKYGVPCIVVDFGTATTFDAINGRGEYMGASSRPASPSRPTRSSSGRRAAAVEIKRPSPSSARRPSAPSNRSLLRYVALVEASSPNARELGEGTRVIATGGLAPLIATAPIDRSG